MKKIPVAGVDTMPMRQPGWDEGSEVLRQVNFAGMMP